jgi:hypothetical protein
MATATDMKTATTTTTMTAQWQELDPTLAGDLVDARLQFHHAAQLATAIGISYLPKQADDSHTNLEWLAALGALASHVVPTSTPFRLAVRPSPLTLLLVDARNAAMRTCSLNGRTIEDACRWLRVMLPDVHADPKALTLDRHYTIPSHAVDDGAPFDTTHERAFQELSRWYGNAALVLSALVAATPQASEVRCWPHHFDIATLIEVEPANGSAQARTIGIGLEPGDNYYAEPYFYVNMYPSPLASRVAAPLAGAGVWHMREWVGAVLPGSRLQSAGQEAQVESFIHSAVRACTDLVKAG